MADLLSRIKLDTSITTMLVSIVLLVVLLVCFFKELVCSSIEIRGNIDVTQTDERKRYLEN